MFVDCHRLVIRNYNFNDNRIKNNIKLVLLTDLHDKTFGKNNMRLVQYIDGINPDLIVIAGDMYTAFKDNKAIQAKNLMKILSQKYNIYYANGNHELKTQTRADEFGPVYSEYIDYLNKCNICHLDNKCIQLDEYNVNIYGLNLPFDYYKKFIDIELRTEDLEKYLGKASKDKVNILLAHNPEYFKSYVSWGADLVLSGHYHGGLMRLPFLGGVISPRYKLFPEYDFGEYEEAGSKMILSCGLGTHTLPIRIFNPGEISVIDINSK